MGVSFPTLPYDRITFIGDDSGSAQLDPNLAWPAYKDQLTRHGINGVLYRDAMVIAKDTNAYNHQSDKWVTFTPELPTEGKYEVFIRWPNVVGAASFVLVEITSAHGTTRRHVDQTANPDTWVSLGKFTYDDDFDFNVEIHNEGTDGYVIADAVRFAKTGQADVIVDNSDPTSVVRQGSWTNAMTAGYNGNYRHDGNTGKSIAPGVAAVIADGELWNNRNVGDQSQGWFFTHVGDAYVAIHVASGGYSLIDFPSGAAHVLKLNDEWSPVVLQMGKASDAYSFAQFIDDVKDQPLTYSSGVLNYTSLGNNAFTYWSKSLNLPHINGLPVVLNPADTYQSPFISSPHNGTTATITAPGLNPLFFSTYRNNRAIS